jgi:hypothetical protein
MELPDSLTSRFLFVSFERLQESDLVVFAHRSMQEALAKHGITDGDDYCLQLARRMVPVHMELERLATNPGSSFGERRAYAELTIRDMMKWCEGVSFCICRHGLAAYPFHAAPSDALAALLFSEGWAVYGARFRLTESRNSVVKILRDALGGAAMAPGGPAASLAREQHPGSVAITFGHFTLTSRHVAPLAPGAKTCPFAKEMITMHQAVAAFVFSPEVLARLGVAAAFPSMLVASARWMELAKRGMRSEFVKAKFALIGACMYANAIRVADDSVRTRVLHLAATTFSVPGAFNPDDVHDCEMLAQAALPPPSLALTTRLSDTLRLIVRAASLRQPVLVVGCDGTGKSDCIVALAALLGKSLERVCVTGETDSAELVMERLNPLLEASPVWQLTEKDDGEVWCCTRACSLGCGLRTMGLSHSPVTHVALRTAC